MPAARADAAGTRPPPAHAARTPVQRGDRGLMDAACSSGWAICLGCKTWDGMGALHRAFELRELVVARTGGPAREGGSTAYARSPRCPQEVACARVTWRRAERVRAAVGPASASAFRALALTWCRWAGREGRRLVVES